MNKSVENIFPLADKLRPDDITLFEGQEHLTGSGKIIRSFIEKGVLNSLIFWGPPGIGKTTLSRLLVKSSGYPSIEFSAAVSKIAEIRDVMKEAKKTKEETGKPLVLFVDEIHHFNRHMQDAFLPFVEQGDIILLGTTTENPAYKINRALLSRIKILELFSLNDDPLKNILEKGIRYINEQLNTKIKIEEKVVNTIINYAAGDSRRMLNLLEVIVTNLKNRDEIDLDMIDDVISNRIGGYDRTGDDRYGLISAYHKSIRNSDVDSSLFWLYKMMEGGEDPHFLLRRMIRISAEDIGFADPEALTICLKGKEAYDFLGSPEGDIFLTQITIYLALAPKSNSLYLTEKKMKDIISKYRSVSIPMHLINPANFISRKKGAGKDYLYAHDFKEKTTAMNTMPDSVKEENYYIPNSLGFEKKINERIEYWKKLKTKLK